MHARRTVSLARILIDVVVRVIHIRVWIMVVVVDLLWAA